MSPPVHTRRPTVLILLGALWPGNDSSGANQTVKRLCMALADDFEFLVLARSAAPGEPSTKRFPDGWHGLEFARVKHLPVRGGIAKGLLPLLRSTRHDLLWLNSVWDREFTLPALAARRFGAIPRHSTLLSTHGELSDQALGLKPVRKRAMRAVLNHGRLLDDVVLQVSTPAEGVDVARYFPRSDIFCAGNAMPFPPPLSPATRQGGVRRALFVGRISPVKGLMEALEALALVDAPLRFDIAGPIADAEYWRRCQTVIARLPSHVTVGHLGELSSGRVSCELAQSDFLLLPSHSENFGHAIFEALAAGVPVVIGPNTPWQELEFKHAGVIAEPSDARALADAIARLATLPSNELPLWRQGAWSVAQDYVAASPDAELWRVRLNEMLARAKP